VDIDVEHLSPRIHRILPRRGIGPGDTCRADEDVDAAEFSLGGSSGAFDRSVVRDIERMRYRARSHGGARCSERMLVAIPQCDASATGDDALRNGETNPRRAAGHHRAATSKIHLVHRHSGK